ncbi:MAG: threonine aldolase [Candidatus Paceibacteria bacterium]|jgi:threonine aldolase
MKTDLEQYRIDLKARCKPIHGHGYPDSVNELQRVAEWCTSENPGQDFYGTGELIQEFEGKLAALFGKPSARFMPSGTMAQGIAMRLWSGAGGHFGMHPTSHLELHEQRGYSHLFGLRATLIGPEGRPMLRQDLESLTESIGALIIELPTRENGGQLPSWDELVELCGLARERGCRLHLDGARIWEAQAAMGHSFEEIGALFDSVYASFYKGIGALSGAMLIGPADFIQEAQLWQRRMGGNLFSLLPNVASAASRFDQQLARFPLYLTQAQGLAEGLAQVSGLRLLPDKPQTSMMHVQLDLDPDPALTERDRVAEETGLWLLGQARPGPLEGQSRFEISIGDAFAELDVNDVVQAFQSLLHPQLP